MTEQEDNPGTWWGGGGREVCTPPGQLLPHLLSSTNHCGGGVSVLTFFVYNDTTLRKITLPYSNTTFPILTINDIKGCSRPHDQFWAPSGLHPRPPYDHEINCA